MCCIKEGTTLVTQRHLDVALQSVLPSVSKTDERRYGALRSKLRQSRAHIVPATDTADAGSGGGQVAQP